MTGSMLVDEGNGFEKDSLRFWCVSEYTAQREVASPSRILGHPVLIMEYNICSTELSMEAKNGLGRGGLESNPSFIFYFDPNIVFPFPGGCRRSRYFELLPVPAIWPGKDIPQQHHQCNDITWKRFHHWGIP